MAKLASKHRTSNICLPTCKMCLPNMKCLKKLVVAKRASKERKLKVSHVRQTMLVSFAMPLQIVNEFLLTLENQRKPSAKLPGTLSSVDDVYHHSGLSSSSELQNILVICFQAKIRLILTLRNCSFSPLMAADCS